MSDRMPYRLVPLSLEEETRWDDAIAPCQGREVFHRRAWLDYLAASRGVGARFWAIRQEADTLGYFCAGQLTKGPFRVLGSPLTGWGTNVMGPVFAPGADHAEFLRALDALARRERLATVELESRLLSERALEEAGFEPVAAWSYLVPLDPGDPDAMWRRLHPTCRNRIRKAERAGLRVEDSEDPAFVEEYYEQYAALMRGKGLLPHYPLEYPKLLFAHLKKASALLALRVRDAAGRVLATGLFPHDDRTLYFWGAASWPDSLDACPNDYLHWCAMRLAADRGLSLYNMSGHGRFKKKFGGTLTLVKRWQKYHWRSARWARNGYHWWFQARSSWLRYRPRTAEPAEHARGGASADDEHGPPRRSDDFIEIMRNPGRSLPQRPRFRLSDLWRAPLHHFPIRDELLYQCLPLRPDMEVLEVGPGSGFTAFHVARRVDRLTLLDVAPGNVAHLKTVLTGLSNLRFMCADICDPRVPDALGTQVDAVYALEVFELLPDPETALANMARALRQGGQLLLQFPNYPPPKTPGVTYFSTRAELDRLMRRAGFEVWTIHSLRLRRYPQLVVDWGLERPLRLYRRVNPRGGRGEPLVYDDTWAFQHRHRLEPYKYVIHAAWAPLMGAMRLGGGCFARNLLGDDILNRNLLVLARR